MKLEVDFYAGEAEDWVDDEGALPTASVDRIRDSLRWIGLIGEIKIDGQDAAPALTGPELPELNSALSSQAAEYPKVVVEGSDGEEPEVPSPSEADKAREEAEKQAQKEAEEAANPPAEAKAAPKEKAAAKA